MKQLKTITLLFLILTFISSCSTATYLAGGKQTQFSGRYELPLKENKEKTISDFRGALLTLGFKSSSNTTLKFEKNSGVAAGLGISKVYLTNLDAVIESDKLVINILQKVNYQYGTEEKTNETFNNIKTEYLK